MKNILLLINFILLSQYLLGQILDTSNYKYYAPNGGIFTPKGDLKVLLVFVHFKDSPNANPQFTNANQYIKDWEYIPNSSHHLPQIVNPQTGVSPQIIFNHLSDFETKIDSIDYNYSKDFYISSLGKFRFYGEVFKDSNNKPISIEIDPTGAMSWGQCNKKAFIEMQRINPHFDYSAFDNRKNAPLFAFDNTDTLQYKKDKILDYVIFIYRYSRDWSQQPVGNMATWAGSGGGIATTGLGMEKTKNGYTIREGFTMNFNGGVFIHEVAHTLYNIPHLFGANHVSGEYFYLPNVGWGATNMINIFRGGLTAWERWYLGFIDLLADIPVPKENPKNAVYEYILQDYQTTGDALRIALPFTPNQHLYIENHTGLHAFDKHLWTGGNVNNDTLAPTPYGVYMYVAELPYERTSIVQALSNKANSIRLLNANGNYDYILKSRAVEKNSWGNDIYLWQRTKPNPLNGLNPYYIYPIDKNSDGIIAIDKNYNQARYEGAMILREFINDTLNLDLYAAFGTYKKSLLDLTMQNDYYRNPAFQSGDILGMGTNPTIVNHPMYNTRNAQLAPFIINGLKIELESLKNSKSMKVKIQFGQTELLKNTTWTGNILLPNISLDDQADLIIPKRKTLILSNGTTPNRHQWNENKSFVNPTILTIGENTTLHILEKGNMILDENTTLVLEKGVRLLVDKKATFKVHKKAKIVLKDNAKIVLNKKAKSNYKS